jgi:hypothetical protein
MAEDKKTIGLTVTNKAVMDRFVEEAGFRQDMDAAKFAFALAISRGSQPASVEGASTIWAAGNFDEGGEMKALIQNLYPAVETPYRALESLINAGFGILAKLQADEPGLRVEDLLKREHAETVTP